jgi:hypothetical protein
MRDGMRSASNWQAALPAHCPSHPCVGRARRKKYALFGRLLYGSGSTLTFYRSGDVAKVPGPVFPSAACGCPTDRLRPHFTPRVPHFTPQLPHFTPCIPHLLCCGVGVLCPPVCVVRFLHVLAALPSPTGQVVRPGVVHRRLCVSGGAGAHPALPRRAVDAHARGEQAQMRKV